MRTITPTDLLRLSCGFGLAAGLCASAAVASQTWTAVAVGGDVRAKTAASWAPIVPGDTLPLRSNLSTGEDGRLALLSNRRIVILDPETRLEFDQHASGSAFQQRVGAAYYFADKIGESYSIETSDCRVTTRGASMMVSVERTFSTVHVRAGDAIVTSPRWAGALELQPGDTLLARSGSTPRIVRYGEDAESLLGRRWGRRVVTQTHRFARMAKETDHVQKVVKATRRAMTPPRVGTGPGTSAISREVPLPTPRSDRKKASVVRSLTEAEFAKQFMNAFFEEDLAEIGSDEDGRE